MTGWVETLKRYCGKRSIIWFYVLCALPVCVLTALVTPPGQAPDEAKHLARADGLLHGTILCGRRISVDIDKPGASPEWMTGMEADRGLYLAAEGQVTASGLRNTETAQDFLAIRSQPPDHRKLFVYAPNTATYFPTAYIPAALALAIGLAVKAPPFACFLLARFFTLAAFLLLGGLALWVTAYGEALLFTVLVMPMTLFLASSVSQDGILIGLTCLSAALLTRGTARSWFLALALFVLVLLGKPPYLPLLAVFLLPLSAPGPRARLCAVFIASLPVLLWVALILIFTTTPFDKPAYHPGPLYAGGRGVWMDHTNAAANLHVLLSPASRLVSLPWHTESLFGRYIFWAMIGCLGLVRLWLSPAVYLGWEISLAFAMLGLCFARRPYIAAPAAQMLNFAVITALLVSINWLLLIMFYLNWSIVGLDYVDGMQGRYLLLLVPFLLFAIPGARWRFTLPPLLPALPAIAMGVYDIGYIPLKLVWSFYLY